MREGTAARRDVVHFFENLYHPPSESIMSGRMPTNRHDSEQIVTFLRQIEVEKSRPATYKEAGITAGTFYRRRDEFGGLKVDRAKRLRGWRENS